MNIWIGQCQALTHNEKCYKCIAEIITKSARISENTNVGTAQTDRQTEKIHQQSEVN